MIRNDFCVESMTGHIAPLVSSKWCHMWWHKWQSSCFVVTLPPHIPHQTLLHCLGNCGRHIAYLSEQSTSGGMCLEVVVWVILQHVKGHGCSEKMCCWGWCAKFRSSSSLSLASVLPIPLRPSTHRATQKKLIGHANYHPVTSELLPL